MDGLEGRVVEVDEHEHTITLRLSDGSTHILSEHEVMTLAAYQDEDIAREEQLFVARCADLWNASTELEKAEARARQDLVRQTATGYASGHAGNKRKGEPLPEYSKGSFTDRFKERARRDGKSRQGLINWYDAFMKLGILALFDGRVHLRRDPTRLIDPEWIRIAKREMKARDNEGELDVIGLAQNIEIACSIEDPLIQIPGRRRARLALEWLQGKGSELSRDRRLHRTTLLRPNRQLRRLLTQRPGELTLLDTTKLDVRVRDEVTGEPMSVELTIALDHYSRCVVGLQLQPTTRSIDIGALLFEVFFPPSNFSDLPYAGVPPTILVEEERFLGFGEPPRKRAPSAPSTTLVVDNGKVYVSEYIYALCRRLGTNVEPANLHDPTGKGQVETFFDKLNTFLQHLPGYKGRHVAGRPLNPDKDLMTLAELELEIRLYIRDVYHQSVHASLHSPQDNTLSFTPLERFVVGKRTWGGVTMPLSLDLTFEFMPLFKRHVQPVGVRINGFIYDSPALNDFRGEFSGDRDDPFDFEFRRDPRNVNQIYFRNPSTYEWHEIPWTERDYLGERPLTDEEVRFARLLFPKREMEDQHDLYELLRDFRIQRGLGTFKGAANTRLNLREAALEVEYARLIAETPLIKRDSDSDQREVIKQLAFGDPTEETLTGSATDDDPFNEDQLAEDLDLGEDYSLFGSETGTF